MVMSNKTSKYLIFTSIGFGIIGTFVYLYKRKNQLFHEVPQKILVTGNEEPLHEKNTNTAEDISSDSNTRQPLNVNGDFLKNYNGGLKRKRSSKKKKTLNR